MDDVVDVVEGGELLEPVESVAWWDLPDVVPPSVCNVHRGTGEFLCMSPADPSPLEPGVWVFPAYSYQIEPPELQPGFVSLINRDDNGWEVVADHRGATVYSTETGEPRQWLALGDLPEGYTLQAPETKFDTWKDEQWIPDQAAIAEAARQMAYRQQALSTQYASARISTLQDAVDLDIATEAEVAALKGWKRYRVELGRLNTALAAPTDDEWPVAPEASGLLQWLASQQG